MIWKEFQPGLWLPSQIATHNLIDQLVGRGDYNDYQINAPTDEKAYSYEFSVGTRLQDEIEKKSYVVSAGVVDEQAAIQEFIVSEKLRAVPSSSHSRYWWAAIGTFGVVITLFVGFWLRRRSHRAAEIRSVD